MAPKPRKPLKHKGAIVVSVSATKDTSGKDDLQSTARTSGVQKRRVAKKKQTSEVDLHDTPVVDPDIPEAKVARLTKPTTLSCSPKTNRKSAREKLKNSKSERGKNSGADSVPTDIKRPQRQSKTQAKTRINQHFEGEPRSDDGSVLKEIKIWGEITGTQKRESGMTGRKKGGKQKVAAEENKKQEGETSSEGSETEEVTSETKVKKGKGTHGVWDKPTKPQKERHTKKEQDAAALDGEMCAQESAKGNKYIGAHTSIAGKYHICPINCTCMR